MTLEATSVWQSTWKTACPPTATGSWKFNLSNYVDARVTGKLSSSGVLSSPGVGALSFTFGKAAFLAALSSNAPSVLANAVEAGILASVTLIPPGSFISSDSPATKFSVVTSAVINPASVALAKAKVLTVLGLPGKTDAAESQFPLKLREAFLLLTILTTGLDSTPPPAGPLPLSDPAGGVA